MKTWNEVPSGGMTEEKVKKDLAKDSNAWGLLISNHSAYATIKNLMMIKEFEFMLKIFNEKKTTTTVYFGHVSVTKKE